MPDNRKLRVFLCHSSQDKPIVRELYERLNAEGWIDPWLDKEKLLVGQDFDLEIENAIQVADAVVVFITKNAVEKTGYIQKELRLIYDAAMYKPEGMLFAIPLRLEECDPPSRFRLWHWGDYFGDEKEKTYESLLKSLENIYEQKLQIDIEVKISKEIEERERKEAEEHDRKIVLENLQKEKQEQLHKKKDNERRRVVTNLSYDKFSQKSDIPIECTYLGGNGISELELLIRYMYYRSNESRSSIDPETAIGQDYLLWNYNANNVSFDFVVCDGVGQSFFGNIAAEFLGQKLIDWLKSDGLSLVGMIKKEKNGGFGELAAEKISSWQDEAKKRVQEKQLPKSLPPIVLTALEDSQKYKGSETVFVCGHLSLDEKIPYLVLFWMGDVRFRLFDRDGQEVITEAKWTNTERWSSKYGLKGRNIPHVWVGNLFEQKIARIMVYSDGLSVVEREIAALSSADLQHTANQLLVSPSSDDISFIDILLFPFDKTAQEKFEKLSHIAKNGRLKIAKQQLHESEFLLSWEVVEKADQYLLLEASSTLAWHEVFRSTKLTSFSVKDRLPGNYEYKLRVVYLDANEDEGPVIVLEVKDTEKRQNMQVSISSINQSSASMKTQNTISPVFTSVPPSQFELAEAKNQLDSDKHTPIEKKEFAADAKQLNSGLRKDKFVIESICIGIGVAFIVYFQFEYNNLDSWSYMWTLVLGFVGIGNILTGLFWENKAKNISSGIKWILVSVILFFLFSAFFGG